MARRKFKWKFSFFFSLLMLNVFTKSLPIGSKIPVIANTDKLFRDLVVPSEESISESVTDGEQVLVSEVVVAENNETAVNSKDENNITRNSFERQVRPGQEVRQYAIELTINGNSFDGRAVIDVRLDTATREDPIVLHAEGLNVRSVMAGVFTEANARAADFDVDDGLLEVTPDQIASSYILIVEYSGQLSDSGRGLYRAEFNDVSYVGMNLYPTNARRVFPCMDEPTEASIISFTFNGLDYSNVVSNSMFEENSDSQFRALQGPPHLWGMLAHNLVNINIPTTNVLLFGRSGVSNQDGQASVALNFFYNNLIEWTGKEYFEIVLNQDGRMNVIALPDTAVEWYALSTVCIWEPYILMETTHSVKQRKTALVEIAQGLTRQWFGYVLYPENWRYQWVISGLSSYAAYDVVNEFQTDPLDIDTTLIDMNTIFTTDIIQESLLRDAYQSAQVLEPDEDLFDEEMIRDHIYGLVKYKSPAILRMLRIVLGIDTDFIHLAAQTLLSSRSLQTINTMNFYDAINGEWWNSNNQIIDDVADFLEPWVTTTGYPLLHVGLRQGGVLITQERFGFSDTAQINYNIPISYTTSVNPNFDISNIYPERMMDTTTTINIALSDDDWVLFNIQGQGYYRVNYDSEMWERIIEALDDPDRREQIHPLNRATLIDDALNLARAGKLDYDVAFGVVLTMQHETEYAPWKAFVRNMDFLRKRLVAFVTEDDLDSDIYVRMVRRTVGSVESEIGFSPDPLILEPAMTSLTRGLVMDHACRANYQPCIAAAIDWFYDPNSSELTVNPNIPHEIRPAVYCTMVREGDNQVIAALYARLEIEPSHYERVVILESLACSRDDNFIRILLEETIASNSPYGVEERGKIFAAVAESSYENARIAMSFLSMRTNEIRNTYGGPEKLEAAIFAVAENMANSDLVFDYTIWINSINSNIDDSMTAAERARDQVNENLEWENNYMESVYEWIDENDAPTLAVSLVLILTSFVVTLLNN